MFFSILIPVYNVERFLAECVESVLRQTYTDYELLLIDDGSTDSSGVICDMYAKSDPRIIVFHKTNEGAYFARCYAIERAKGKYLLFLDSDDMWDNELLQMVYDTILEHSADMVLYRLKRVDEYGKFIGENYRIFHDQTVFTNENKINIFSELAKGSSGLNNLYTKAVNKEIVDQSSNYIGNRITLGEDLLQVLVFLKNAKKIVYRDKAYYFYRQHANSITHSFNPSYITDLDYVRHEVYKFLCSLGYDTPTNQKAFFLHYLNIVLTYVIKLMTLKIPYDEKIVFLKLMRNLDYFQQTTILHCYRHLPLRRVVIYILFNNKRYKVLQGVVGIAYYIRKRFKRSF